MTDKEFMMLYAFTNFIERLKRQGHFIPQTVDRLLVEAHDHIEQYQAVKAAEKAVEWRGEKT